MSLGSFDNCMRVVVLQRMVPFLLVDPSTLYAWMAVGSFFKGKLVRKRSPRSMKLPVAPESMRAVVSTICFPTSSLIGKRRVHSL